MAYGMAERELYALRYGPIRYGPKGAVWLTVWPTGSYMVYDMAERELHDPRYGRKEAVWPAV